MRTGLIAAVLALLLAATNLGASELSDIYFPLKEGLTWTYQAGSDQHPNKKIVVTNMPTREVKGTKVTPRKSVVDGVAKYYLIGTDDQGVYRFGEQSSETAEPEIVTPKVYYLKNPLSRGTTWDIKTKLGQEEIDLKLTIESVSESVTVPAGSYKDCLLIKSVGGDPQKDLSLEAFDWYAPQVGLVKSMVTATKIAKDKTKKSDHLTYQLESFKP